MNPAVLAGGTLFTARLFRPAPCRDPAIVFRHSMLKLEMAARAV